MIDSLHVVIPGDLETRTGGYGYDRRIIAGLRDAAGGSTFASWTTAFRCRRRPRATHATQVLAGIPDGSTVLVDGLALGALPVEIEREAARLRLVALVHHPLAAETGIDPALAASLEDSERRALAAVRAVVVTSRATAARLDALRRRRESNHVVEPGTDPAPLARGSAAARSAARRRPSVRGDADAAQGPRTADERTGRDTRAATGG